ncbi:MAG: molybdenum cofactor guanylyltransferase [Myxococcota bacterium]
MRLTHVEGAVLCGGASTRMGRDKATLPYEGVPLGRRVADALAECLARVRIVGKANQLPALGLEVIVDRHPTRAPLIGVAAALAACEASAVLVAACDLVHLDPRVVLALTALAPADGAADVIAPLGPRGPEPLLAIYRPRLLLEIERRIARGELALRALLRDVATLFIPEADLRALDPSLRSLTNANFPEDLQ